MEQISRPVVPLLVASILALAVVTVFPGVALFLPRLLGMM